MMTGIFELYRITASSSGAPEYPIVPAMSGIPESYGDWYNANGLYKIYDASQTGTNRIWKHETEEFYIRYVYGQWALVRSTSDTSYSLYISNYSGSYSAPYDEKTGESYTWTYQGSTNSSITFELETYGNTNFFLKDPSDESMMYDGVYVKQMKRGINYMIPCSDGQLWIQNPSFELNEANKSTRCALWCDGTNYMIGTVQVDSSGNVTEKTPKYTVAGNGTWPWKMIEQFGDGSLSIKKTQDSTLIIPQGVEVTEGNYYDSLIAKYLYRYVSGNAFPVEGDTFYEYDQSGKKFICYKDSSTSTLKWGLRSNGSTYDSYTADATWFWPDKAKFSMSYGGSGAVVNAVSTGDTNIRIIQTSLDTPTDFTDFGVYIRLTGYTNQSYNITFDYSSTAIAADQINGQNITSHAKVWIKAADYEAFMNSEPMGDTEYRAIIMLSPGRSNIAITPEIENTNDTIYEPNFYCFGTVTKGVGTTYLSITSIKGFCYAPAMFWPWELDTSFYSGITIFRSELDDEPVEPPVSFIASGLKERCNGIYSNRTLSREDIPSGNDVWYFFGLNRNNRDTFWYNKSKFRWECFYSVGASNQYCYSTPTIERWPDDPALLWYSGDRGDNNLTGGNDKPYPDASIVRTENKPIDRVMTVFGLTKDTTGTTQFDGILYPIWNEFDYKKEHPSTTDMFAFYLPASSMTCRCTLKIVQSKDGKWFWSGGAYQGWEQEENNITNLIKSEQFDSSDAVPWPWEISGWSCTNPGGTYNQIVTPPIAFGVSDDPEIKQYRGDYDCKITISNAGDLNVNGVWTMYRRNIYDDELTAPTVYDYFVMNDKYAMYLYGDVGNSNNEIYWQISEIFPPGSTKDSNVIRYSSSSMKQSEIKWPWEITFNGSPAPVVTLYDATTRGMYWGDQITLQKSDDGSKKILDFNVGTILPDRIDVRYEYEFSLESSSGSVSTIGLNPWSGVFVNAPNYLLYEIFHDYDVVYISEKTDTRSYGYNEAAGTYVETGYDGGQGFLVGKYNSESGSFDWELFGTTAISGAMTKVYPTYKASGNLPFNLTWTDEHGDTVSGSFVMVSEIEGANDSNSTAPGLVPKAKYQWKTADNTASVVWNTTEKRYELSLDGQSFNSVAFDEETPSLFPWELTEKQWNNIPCELGIKGSRVLVHDTKTSGNTAEYKADGWYYSYESGGKFSDASKMGYNHLSYYHKRQSSNIETLSPDNYFRFELYNYNGDSWKLYGGRDMTRFVRQNVGDWGGNWGNPLSTLPPPYDFTTWFHHEWDGKIDKILPSFGHMIPNGQIDYETVAYFGVRFSVTVKKDNGTEYTVPFVYSSPNIGFNGYPVEGQTWTGTYESDTYKWQWNTEQLYWELLVNGVVQVHTTVRTGNQPDLFPWEYRSHEYSTWTKAQNGSGYVILSSSTNGSRIVISGAADTYYGNINRSYVSYYADPYNHGPDSDTKMYRWINEYGGDIGRFNTSSRWNFSGISDQIYAKDSNKLPWFDEDFTTNSSYPLKPSNFLLNGRPQENTTEFASMYEIYGSESELNGSYVLVGYTYASEDVFDILTYRNTSTGALLRRENSTWTLSLNGVVKYQASDATLHYPQDTEVTWEATSSGAADTTPYIVAVDAMTKIPAVNNWNMTVADAGEASVNGTYTEDHSAGAYGIDRSWTSESGSIIKYADSAWGIYTSDTLMYTVDATQLEDGTSSDPYGEEGVTLTWTAESGAEPVPSVTAEVVLDTITVSGASDAAINGEYNLVDTAAEGDDRIWTNGTYYIARGTSYTVWMLRNTSGRPSNPGSGGVYFYGSDTSKANPYNDDGTSYTWYSMSGSGTLSVIKN